MSWDAYDELDIQASSIGSIREITLDTLHADDGALVLDRLSVEDYRTALRRILRIADDAAVSLDDFNERVQ